MLVSVLVLLLAQSPIEQWIDDLSSPMTGVRRAASLRLLHGGDAAARALEARMAGLESPEARLRAAELLQRLRTPRASLRAPVVVDEQRALVTLELLVVNPRPVEVRLEGFQTPSGRKWVPNRNWSLDIGENAGAPSLGDRRLRRPLVVPPRSEAVYELPIVFRFKGRKEIGVRVRYRGEDFRLDARAEIRVGAEPLTQVRRQLFHVREEERAAALRAIRGGLRGKRRDHDFVELLRLGARSPYRDVRLGLAVALGEVGRLGQRSQLQTVCALALDRDVAVARAACAAFGRLASPRTPVPEAYRTAAKLLARDEDPRTAALVAALGRWTRIDRRVFLAGVLARSRAPVVHENVASLLRREGVPVEPGAGGLVPPAQIRNLAR